jgi:hypothetical protein
MRVLNNNNRLGGNDKYSVLRNDLLSGEGMNGLEEKDFDSIIRRVAALRPIADILDCTLAQLALAWYTYDNLHMHLEPILLFIKLLVLFGRL